MRDRGCCSPDSPSHTMLHAYSAHCSTCLLTPSTISRWLTYSTMSAADCACAYQAVRFGVLRSRCPGCPPKQLWRRGRRWELCWIVCGGVKQQQRRTANCQRKKERQDKEMTLRHTTRGTSFISSQFSNGRRAYTEASHWSIRKLQKPPSWSQRATL